MPDLLVTLAADLAGVPPDAVELTETHISRVALAGPPGPGVALKQCKAVDFGFVDLSTPAARRAALEKEKAVNDRFAPGVYVGVVDLPGGEPALHMRRLDAADTLAAKVLRVRRRPRTSTPSSITSSRCSKRPTVARRGAPRR